MLEVSSRVFEVPVAMKHRYKASCNLLNTLKNKYQNYIQELMYGV
jgi:hypothetical protein